MMLVCICSIDTCLKHIKNNRLQCNVHGFHGNKNTEFDKSAIRTQQKLFSSINFSIIFKIKSANFPIVNYFRQYTIMVQEYLLYYAFIVQFQYYTFIVNRRPGWLNELGGWIYKPITNTAWVRPRLCKLQNRVHSTRNHK